jgi:hypothetical protein
MPRSSIFTSKVKVTFLILGINPKPIFMPVGLMLLMLHSVGTVVVVSVGVVVVVSLGTVVVVSVGTVVVSVGVVVVVLVGAQLG